MAIGHPYVILKGLYTYNRSVKGIYDPVWIARQNCIGLQIFDLIEIVRYTE
jgi:hypothetical protein